MLEDNGEDKMARENNQWREREREREKGEREDTLCPSVDDGVWHGGIYKYLKGGEPRVRCCFASRERVLILKFMPAECKVIFLISREGGYLTYDMAFFIRLLSRHITYNLNITIFPMKRVLFLQTKEYVYQLKEKITFCWDVILCHFKQRGDTNYW